MLEIMPVKTVRTARQQNFSYGINFLFTDKEATGPLIGHQGFLGNH
jgi:hypothetical protein